MKAEFHIMEIIDIDSALTSAIDAQEKKIESEGVDKEELKRELSRWLEIRLRTTKMINS